MVKCLCRSFADFKIGLSFYVSVYFAVVFLFFSKSSVYFLDKNPVGYMICKFPLLWVTFPLLDGTGGAFMKGSAGGEPGARWERRGLPG